MKDSRTSDSKTMVARTFVGGAASFGDFDVVDVDDPEGKSSRPRTLAQSLGG